MQPRTRPIDTKDARTLTLAGGRLVVRRGPGVGKDLRAQALHDASPRARLVVFDCSAVSPGLMESGLFGHEKEAFREDHFQALEQPNHDRPRRYRTAKAAVIEDFERARSSRHPGDSR